MERYGEQILQADAVLLRQSGVAGAVRAPGLGHVRSGGLRRSVAGDRGPGHRCARAWPFGGDRRRLAADAADLDRQGQRRRPPATADEEDGEVLEDLESILTECVESGLPREWLSWHYRSQDETLIAFSNAHYYEGKLASLPSPGGDPTAGIELRRVPGHFNREDKQEGLRTNRVEAEAIVAEIRRRLSDPERCRPVDRRSDLQQPAAGLDPEPARGMWGSARRATAAGGRRRGHLRQEPGERPGRRARRHPLLACVLQEA